MIKQSTFILFIVGVLLFFAAIFLPHLFLDNIHASKISTAEFVFHQKEEKANEILKELPKLKSHKDDQLEKFSAELENLYSEEGMAYYAFHGKQMIYWSDDAIAFQLDSILYEKEVQKLGNGWYKIVKQSVDEYTYVALIQIYEFFEHQNQYLQPGFQEAFKLDENYIFSLQKNGYPIYSVDGEYSFSVQIKNFNKIPYAICYFFNVLYFLAIAVFLILIAKMQSVYLKSTVSIALLVILRFLMAAFRFPQSLYQLEMFGPEWYDGSYWIASFGDLFLHGVVLFLIAYHVQQIIRAIKTWNKFLIVLFSFLPFLISHLIILLTQELIWDSRMSFDLNNLFQLNLYSYLGLVLIGIFFFSFFLLTDALLKKLFHNFSRRVGITVLLMLFFLNLLLLFFIEQAVVIYHLWILFPFLIIYLKGRKHKYYSLPSSLILLLVFAFIAALLIQNEGKKKEIQSRTDAIHKLAEEEDPIAEYLFTEIQRKLSKDTTAYALLSNYWSNENEVKDYLKNKYFNAYWEKFEVFFTPCYVGDSLVVAPNNVEVDCIHFFRQRLRNEGKMVSSNNLFQLNNTSGRISYLAEIPIVHDGEQIHLFIELYTRVFNDNNGYPELLLDEHEISRTINLEEYSFAIYNKKRLINSSGKYNYSMTWNSRLPTANKVVLVEKDGYEHLLLVNKDRTLFMLSKQKDNVFNFLTTLSYLLTIFAITFILFSFLVPAFPVKVRLSSFDFTARLQLFIIGSLFTTLMLFGISTSYYIQKQYQQKNYQNISEKMRSILIEIDQKIGAQDVLDESMKDYVTFLLIKFSNVFYTDINLYTPDGMLYASSRPEIFDVELKARRMDPQAVQAMILKHKKEFIQEESIGKMEYLSAYESFRNNENELMAYLNLPYFAKQNQLEKEISAFLVSTINLYVIIFALAILISVFIVNQLSKPLRLIREKIRKLRLGASNELIEWESEDEIGSLVKEYNRMVVELGESVDLLAKTERESAWREMAKQVAHEIKNPLTPMKLSIQHLKRAYDHDSEDLDLRIERTTQTLIEQIDTLAGIANEFSTFAQMPEAQKEKTDLIKSIKTAANLYREKDKLEINITSETDEAFVLADKDHLVRVFNNLVKNAVQSVPEEREGRVDISIENEKKYWKVCIEDNGSGIAPEIIERIFTPNFTTKTGGMGLGLAMVKTILDNLEGEIWFETRAGEGTIFFIRLPKEDVKSPT